MLNSRTYILIILTLIVGGVLNGLVSEQSSQPRFSLGGTDFEPQRQTSGERVWRAAPAKKLWTVGGEDSTILYGSLRAKVAADGFLLVADYSDFKIKEFSPGGEYLRTYGRGRGQGPGEFGTITDYDVRRPGELWVGDNSNGRILVFDRDDGSVKQTIKLSQQPYRLLVRNPGELLLMQPFAENRLFARVTPAGEQLAAFGELIENQARNSLVLDGLIDADGEDGFVYAGHYASLIAAYSMEGEQRYVVETIDPFPMPKIVQNSKGVRRVEQTGRGNAWSINVVDGEIHLLSAIRDGFDKIATIDTYDLADGSYLYSRKPPEHCRWLAVTQDHLYTVTDTTVTKWALES